MIQKWLTALRVAVRLGVPPILAAVLLVALLLVAGCVDVEALAVEAEEILCGSSSRTPPPPLLLHFNPDTSLDLENGAAFRCEPAPIQLSPLY